MKKHIWATGFSIVLAVFTAFLALDTFVFSSAYQTNATQENTSMFEEQKNGNNAGSLLGNSGTGNNSETGNSSGEGNGSEAGNNTETGNTITQPVVTDNSYEDENIKITLTEYTRYNTKIYVADVQVSSAEHLKTAFAKGTYGKNVTAATSVTAAENNAVFAVNGDYYGARNRGYVIRNGIVYRKTASTDDLLCIMADGTLKIMDQSSYSADELVNMGVWQAFAFGPGLVDNGGILVDQGSEVAKAMSSNPRTAIGQIAENHYVFVVTDGRTRESSGLSLYQLAQFMQELGAVTAYNLDGGGSSTMYFNGRVVNNPSTNGRISERKVSDIVYIR